MGELFRSEEMVCVQLFIQYEAAHATVDELGKMGSIQFTNLNPNVNALQRNFVTDLKRTDDLERRLRYFRSQLKAEHIAVRELEPGQEDPAERDAKIDSYETKFEELEKDLSQSSNYADTLKRQYHEHIELRHVLEKDAAFFQEAGDFQGEAPGGEVGDEESGVNRPLLGNGGNGQPLFAKAVQLGFISGVIDRKQMDVFERVLWRSTRGNLFMKIAEIEHEVIDPQSLMPASKNVFIIFYQGERSQAKIKKICESFNANLYPIPPSARDRLALLDQVRSRITDLDNVLKRTYEQRRKVLLEVAEKVEGWRVRVLHEKAIFNTLNMFLYEPGKKTLVAEGWCPVKELDNIQAALRRATNRSGAQQGTIMKQVRVNDQPPTYFRTNKFTVAFQDMIESYGVARYGEVNPAVFSIVTFPFLFGVMFGDIGHGVMLTLIALAYIYWEESFAKIKNEMISMTFSGRYMLLLMGLFSIYTGALYNECFSVPLSWAGTNWRFPPDYDGSQDYTATFVKSQSPVVFGVDVAWKGSKNELSYYNSLKMKTSVLLGVIQMLLGVCLSAISAIHFKKPFDIYFQFIPQVIFLGGLFGYLCFLVVLKWWMPFGQPGYEGTDYPPFLLTTMINIFLQPGSVESPYFGAQHAVQLAILFAAIASVPVMLVAKPCALKRQHRQRMRAGFIALDDREQGHGNAGADSHEQVGSGGGGGGGGGGGHDEHGEEFDFGEIFVHQVIHTIEFVLGAVSNTASYLRLWALSLAHSELSTVFWELVLVRGLSSLTGTKYQFIAIFIAFAVWAGLSVGVLLVMESLSAFLHALRLHWVEFMNKFYFGDGRKFEPFSYIEIIKKANEDEAELRSPDTPAAD